MHTTLDLIPYGRSDVADALADLLRLQSGAPVDSPDPIAEHLANRGIKLPQIAAHLAGMSPDGGTEIFKRALVTSDFGSALGVAMSRIIATNYRRQAAEHAQIVRDVPSAGVKAVNLPTLDIGELAELPASGVATWMPLSVASAGETVQPAIFGAKFLISRDLLLNDSSEIIVSAIDQLAGAAVRLEASALAAILADNPALADGADLINATNSTSSSGLDLTSVAEALNLMRTNTTPAGNVANVRGAFLLVPPDLEPTALVLVASMTPAGQAPRLGVVVNSWLTSSDCYLIADPREAATFIRVYPRGWTPEPSVESVAAVDIQNGETVLYDGKAYRAEHIFGMGVAGRVGIVKIPAAS